MLFYTYFIESIFKLQEDKRQNKKESNKSKATSSSDSGDDFRLVRYLYNLKS